MISTTRGPGRLWGARAWWCLLGGVTAGRQTEGTGGQRGRGSGRGRWSWLQRGPAVLQIDRYAQRDLKKGLHLYGTPGNVGLTNAWSIIQTDVRRGVAGAGPGCGRGRGRAGPLCAQSQPASPPQFRCCGVSNYTDWFEVYNATRVPDSCCLEFSESCGLHAPGTWWKAVSLCPPASRGPGPWGRRADLAAPVTPTLPPAVL